MTRLAVLSDIHGNSFALAAVLQDIQDAGVDLMVNLGDIDDAGGAWRAEPRQVRYDHETAASAAEANGRADLAYTLRTGRAG